MSLNSLAKKIAEVRKDNLRTTEVGTPYSGNVLMREMQSMLGAPADYRSSVAAVAKMDKGDGRVKRTNARIASDATRNGFTLHMPEGDEDPRISAEAKLFIRSAGLKKPQRRSAHLRSLLRSGELWLQWVLDDSGNIVGCIKMPSTSMKANVDKQGKFNNPEKAFTQIDPSTGSDLATFALWQITQITLDGNPDDPAERGRPLLDASVKKHKQLDMSEDDLVIRRRVRAPQRFLHILENAQADEIEAYKEMNKDSLENPLNPMSDFFSNRKGSITAIQGDANMGEIADVDKLEDDFFAGSPIPKFMLGKVTDVSRDVFEDALRGYYEFLEDLQELLADGYEEGFRLQLLLRNINSDNFEWNFKFGAPTVESPNQRVDRLLKEKALGIPPSMLWQQAGYSPEKVKEIRKKDMDDLEPYPLPTEIDGDIDSGGLTVVEGNKRKKESSVAVKSKSKKK